jgi:hypothetical protein
MIKRLSIVLLVLLMWVSVGYSRDLIDREKNLNPNSHDMSVGMSTSKPQVQSNNGGCVGPYDYEQLNQDTQRIMNEYSDSNQPFCEATIYGVEFKVVPAIVMITMFEDVRDRGNFTRDPQKNAKVKMIINAEIMKYQMMVRVVDYNLQQTDRRRYYMWLDSQQKVKRALRNNVNFRKIVNKVHAEFVKSSNK